MLQWFEFHLDVFGILTEIEDVDELRTFRSGKIKVESSEV